jgi:nucleotide-binding universal stress UspA family protein
MMAYQTIMVHLRLGHTNDAVLHISRYLAERFNANVIGIMVGQQTQMIYGRGYALLDFFDREEAHIEQKIAEAETSFKNAFKGFSKSIEWRSTITREPMADYILANTCSADVVITGIAASDFYEGPYAVNSSEIIMQAGRPVLVIPEEARPVGFENILVAWKDTREARRSVVDALPLFKLATQVTVVEICDESEVEMAEQRLADVLAWLVRHGIAAKSVVSVSVDTDATQLSSIAKQQSADLVVAGAYGHSRLREWALGGVTDELLRRADLCALLSH